MAAAAVVIPISNHEAHVYRTDYAVRAERLGGRVCVPVRFHERRVRSSNNVCAGRRVEPHTHADT